MFERLKTEKTVIVTGAHRSGTTIAAEMIAHDTGLKCVREEAFSYRDIVQAEKLIHQGGAIQAPYLLPWIMLWPDVKVILMMRDPQEVQESVSNLKSRGVSAPFYSKEQADRLLRSTLSDHPRLEILNYNSLQDHPMWRDSRNGWGHRQIR